jgi:hypothetical protein
MNSKTLSVFAALALSATGWAAGNDTGRVTVGFDHPENFTDVKQSFNSDSASSPYLDDFRRFIQTRAVRFLPEGQKLSVTFTDIDLAGDFEPWRGPRTQDTRIIKSIYIPRLKFNYQITDASGAVVKQGQANLTDLNFQEDTPITVDSSEPLRYEKRMLDDWFHDTLKEPKKKK